STLARELGRLTGLPVVHLDRLFWKSGWNECTKDEFDAKLDEALKQHAWIMDGNYGRTIGRRAAVADTILLFNFPTWQCLRGAAMRRVQHHRTVRPDMTEGCPERSDLEFFRYILAFRRKSLPGVLSAIERHRAGKTVVEFRSRRDVQRWLERVGSELTRR